MTTIEAKTKKRLTQKEMEALKKTLHRHHFFAKFYTVTL